jgi:hypothetical protein
MYDIKIKLCHLPRMPQFNPSDDSSGDMSMEPETQQGTETPASSLDFDMANIDPRLMEPGPITVTETPTCPLSAEVSASSAGYLVTGNDSILMGICTRRVTRGAANAANIEPGSQLPSPHATRSSRKRGRPEEQPGGEQKEKGRPGKMKASTIKLTPRRSERLRAR